MPRKSYLVNRRLTGAKRRSFCLGRAPGGMEERWRGGLTDVGKDLRDGPGVSQKGDESEGGAAGRADQRERPIDASQECGPPGRPRGACGWGFRCRPIGFGRQGRCGPDRQIRDEFLGGGIVLVSPGRDEGPHPLPFLTIVLSSSGMEGGTGWPEIMLIASKRSGQAS